MERIETTTKEDNNYITNNQYNQSIFQKSEPARIIKTEKER